MKLYTIDVTQDHIRKARKLAKDRRGPKNCPIARAIHEQTPFKRAQVWGNGDLELGLESGTFVVLPHFAKGFVFAFDGSASWRNWTGPVPEIKPFSFQVELPA